MFEGKLQLQSTNQDGGQRWGTVAAPAPLGFVFLPNASLHFCALILDASGDADWSVRARVVPAVTFPLIQPPGKQDGVSSCFT